MIIKRSDTESIVIKNQPIYQHKDMNRLRELTKLTINVQGLARFRSRA